MRMKTFRAATATQAFAKVKADLGRDAVILSNTTVEEDGRKCCEVVAAIDSIPEPATQATKEDFLEGALSGSTGWQREWSQIKGHILALMKPQMDLNKLYPKHRIALEYLEREDVGEHVIMQAYCGLTQNPDSSVLSVLNKFAAARPLESERWDTRFHAFAGPNGAGKTSTLIRFALREGRRNPRSRICVATADSSRGKGRLELRHYAELSGFDYMEIVTRDDFASLRKKAHRYDLVLLDIPGLSARTNLEEWLALYGMTQAEDMAIHLVLNPYYSAGQLDRFIEKYKSPRLASVIWTKLDEACTFGAIMNMAFASGLPVSALSFGSGLKNSIKPATKEMIWRLIFMRKLPNGEIQP